MMFTFPMCHLCSNLPVIIFVILGTVAHEGVLLSLHQTVNNLKACNTTFYYLFITSDSLTCKSLKIFCFVRLVILCALIYSNNT